MKSQVNYPSGYDNLDYYKNRREDGQRRCLELIEYFSTLSELEQLLYKPPNSGWGSTKAEILMDILKSRDEN